MTALSGTMNRVKTGPAPVKSAYAMALDEVLGNQLVLSDRLDGLEREVRTVGHHLETLTTTLTAQGQQIEALIRRLG